MDFSPLEVFFLADCNPVELTSFEIKRMEGCGSPRECLGGFRQRSSQPLGARSAALREVFATSAASAEFGHRLFQQSGHIIWLPRGLCKHQRRLRGIGRTKRDRRGLPRQLLRQAFDEIEGAMGESADYEPAPVSLG